VNLRKDHYRILLVVKHFKVDVPLWLASTRDPVSGGVAGNGEVPRHELGQAGIDCGGNTSLGRGTCLSGWVLQAERGIRTFGVGSEPLLFAVSHAVSRKVLSRFKE